MKTIILKVFFILVCWIGMTSVTKADAVVRLGEWCAVDVYGALELRITMVGNVYDPTFVEVENHGERFIFRFMKMGDYIITFSSSSSSDYFVVTVLDKGEGIPTVHMLRPINLNRKSNRLMVYKDGGVFGDSIFEKMPIKEPDDLELFIV